MFASSALAFISRCCASWTPSDKPTAPPNQTLQFVWALNDDPRTTGGWTTPALGVAGAVRHRLSSAGVETELCLTVPTEGRQKGKVSLSACVAERPNESSVTPPNQTW
eukprot:COSAG01_NODE_8322_length_2830_cov_3.827928_2_plen_108_part_00